LENRAVEQVILSTLKCICTVLSNWLGII